MTKKKQQNNYEIWKDVEGFNGRYQISSYSKKILNPYIANGYFKVDLYMQRKRKKMYIHQLVANAFIENKKNKRTVNHRDGNKKNNYYKNLEWNTDQEQNLHKNRVISGVKRGVYKNSMGASWYSKIQNKQSGCYEYLGSFKEKENAYKAFYKRYKELHGVEPW